METKLHLFYILMCAAVIIDNFIVNPFGVKTPCGENQVFKFVYMSVLFLICLKKSMYKFISQHEHFLLEMTWFEIIKVSYVTYM